ncbi:MAG: FHA domain-containing protein [Cyanobacteria bacterium P01_G01_bin.54]
MELENKLNLYQIFQQLYADRPELLADLLRLENAQVEEVPQAIAQQRYVMGVIEAEDVYLVTNTLTGQTHKLYQPQNIWTIGREEDNALTLLDEHLSRYHAAIQYIATQGFFIHDLQSTNGTFLNHEPVAVPIQIREGDRLRIGSTVFSFFCCQTMQTAAPLSAEVIAYFSQSTPTLLPSLDPQTRLLSLPQRQAVQQKKTSVLGQRIAKSTPAPADETIVLTAEEQARVLDRFFGRVVED